MSTLQMSHVVDLEQGNHDVNSGEGSSNDGSCYSRFYSTNGGSYEDCSFACASDPEPGVVAHDPCSERASSASDCSVELGNETRVSEMKVHLDKLERDCRICHMGLESDSHECGVPIELGCSCKDDLAAAHKHCAETWFKIKGNRTCEICHSVAKNVYGANEESAGHSNDSNNPNGATTLSAIPPSAEARRFWHGHRFLNFLLACMVFAFVISWLFHFNVPSS